MKKLYVICVLMAICYSSVIYAQKEQYSQIIAEEKSIELQEIRLNNKKVSSCIKEYVLNEEIDSIRKEYVYRVIFDVESDNKFLMEISLVPPTVLSNPQTVGYFEVGEKYFIVRGQLPDKIFTFDENVKLFNYEELSIKYSNGLVMSYYSRPEEFTTWLFLYEKGKMKFIEKYN